MSLAFFAKPPYIHRTKKRLMRPSSLVRGNQIAEYLGAEAKLNPTEGYENDVCIFVKPTMDKLGQPVDTFPPRTFIDLVDYKQYLDWLRADPKLSGILASQYTFDIVRKYRLPNWFVFIPQQHCNFERAQRDRTDIKNVGIIGGPRTFRYPIEKLRPRLEKLGLNLLVSEDYASREDVVNFYKQIDIQIIWDTEYRVFKTPLKIVNAASFGIPTVGWPHKGYREVEGNFIPAKTIDELVGEVEKLRDPAHYRAAISDLHLLEMAEKYHISKIAEKYRDLEKIA